MKSKHAMIGVLSAAILASVAGCKIHIDIPVKMSMLKPDVSGSETTEGDPLVFGTVRAEIPSCHDFSDTRKPSSSLLETKSKIPTIFNDAEFKECYSKNFVTFAEFSIPIAIDKHKDGKYSRDDCINVISLENQVLSLAIPPSIRNQLQLYTDQSFAIDSLEPVVSIYLKNDIGREIKATVVGIYVDDEPMSDYFCTR